MHQYRRGFSQTAALTVSRHVLTRCAWRHRPLWKERMMDSATQPFLTLIHSLRALSSLVAHATIEAIRRCEGAVMLSQIGYILRDFMSNVAYTCIELVKRSTAIAQQRWKKVFLPPWLSYESCHQTIGHCVEDDVSVPIVNTVFE